MTTDAPAAFEEGKKEHLLALLAVTAGQIIWGFSYLFTRLALRTAHPDVLLSMRFLLASGLMTLMVLTGKAKVSFRGKNLRPLILLVLTEPLYFYFESYGILYSNSTFAGVVLAVVPVVSIFMAILFLREYPTRHQAIFCLLPIAGVIMMTLEGQELGVVQPLGVFFLAGCCLASATFKICNRKSSEEFTAFERTYMVLLVSAVVFTLSALRSTGGDLDLFLAPLSQPSFLFSLIMLAVFCSFTANQLVNYAVARMSVVKLSSFGALTTLCSLFAGVIFLDEPFTLLSMVGALLILVGIREVTRGK